MQLAALAQKMLTSEFLRFDEYVTFIIKTKPYTKQVMLIVDGYRLNKNVSRPMLLLKKLDPEKFIYTSYTRYLKFIDVYNDIAKGNGIDLIKHKRLFKATPLEVRDWIRLFFNTRVLTEENIERISVDDAKVMLSQTKKWYEGADDFKGCCLKKYATQIKLLLMIVCDVEWIRYYNTIVILVAENTEECKCCLEDSQNLKA